MAGAGSWVPSSPALHRGPKLWAALRKKIESFLGFLPPASSVHQNEMPGFPACPHSLAEEGVLTVGRQSQQISIRFRWAKSIETLHGWWPFPFHAHLVATVAGCYLAGPCRWSLGTDHCLRSPAHSTQLQEMACLAHCTELCVTLAKKMPHIPKAL